MRFRLSLSTVSAVLFMTAVVFLSIGCEHDTPVAGQQVGLQATLSSIQDNIFTRKCVNAGCHPGGGAPMSLASGVARGNLVNVVSAYGGRQRVSPGNAANSVLYLKVIGSAITGGAGGRMPLGAAALSQAETDSIAAWINRGALNN
jgi:hypothetical protein